jgi:hypothetical protein
MHRYFMVRYRDPSDPDFPVQDMKPFSKLSHAQAMINEIKRIGPHKDLDYFIEECSYKVVS